MYASIKITVMPWHASVSSVLKYVTAVFLLKSSSKSDDVAHGDSIRGSSYLDV